MGIGENNVFSSMNMNETSAITIHCQNILLIKEKNKTTSYPIDSNVSQKISVNHQKMTDGFIE